MNYQTKDSGKRKEFSSGMARDAESGKPRFELLVLNDIPYEEQMLTRFAALLARGAEKYEERNFEKAKTQEELNRFKESAFRHFMQWICNENDEDHAAAVMFNIMGVEMVKYKIENYPNPAKPFAEKKNKYRIYDTKNKRFCDETYINKDGLLCKENKVHENQQDFAVQYSTGFLDIENNEIFEGDYLKGGTEGIERPLCSQYRGEVFYLVKNDFFDPMNGVYMYGCGYMEPKEERVRNSIIIGNLFNKSDLIKKIEKDKLLEQKKLKALEVLQFKLKSVAVEEANKLKKKLLNKGISRLFCKKSEKKLMKSNKVENWLEVDMYKRDHILQFLRTETVYALNKFEHKYSNEFLKIKNVDPFLNKKADSHTSSLIEKYSAQYTEEIQKFNDSMGNSILGWGIK